MSINYDGFSLKTDKNTTFKIRILNGTTKYIFNAEMWVYWNVSLILLKGNFQKVCIIWEQATPV